MSRWDGLLRRARERRGLTQRQLADRLRISPQSVNYAERTTMPTLTQLDRYARALGYRLEIRLVDEQRPGKDDIV